MKQTLSQPALSFQTALAIAGAVIAVNIAIVVGTAANLPLRIMLNDLLLPIVTGLAAAALIYAARRSRPAGRRLFGAWLCLAAGQMVATVGNVAWDVLEIGLGQNPSNNTALGILFLLGYLLTGAGVLILAKGTFKREAVVRSLLDMGIVLVAGGLLFWFWVLVVGLTPARTAVDPFEQVVVLLYPLMDFMLFTALIQLVFRQTWSRGHGPIMLMIAGLSFRILSDVANALQSLQGGYITGGWLDVGLTISFTLFGLAGYLQAVQGPIEEDPHWSGPAVWVQTLPYLWVFVVGGLMLWSDNQDLGVNHDFLEWGFVSIVGLVIVRQWVAIRENVQFYGMARQEIAERQRAEAEIKQLNEDLERHVLERTTQLEAANQGLQLEISERRRAEAALYESETRFRTLVEQLPAITYIVPFAETQRTLYVSPQIETILGFSQAEWTADPDLWSKQLHPDDRERVLAEDAGSSITGVFSSEYRIRTRDGRVVWLRDLSRRVYDEVGQARFSQGIEFDITHLKQTEAALRQSEAELRALFAAMNDVVIVYDREGRYLRVAPTNTSLLYKPPDEMLGKTLHDVLPTPQADLLLNHIQLALEKQQAVTVDYSLNIDGREIWFAGMISPMPNEAAVLVARDITERKRAEARTSAFGSLAQRLNSTTNPQEAARIIVDVAGQLLGWDACFLDLFSAEQDRVFPILAMDMIGSQRVDVPTESLSDQPTPMLHRTINEGGQLMLLAEEETDLPSLRRFGDISRASASLMYVPIRNGAAMIGVLSIQSYTRQAYNQESLGMLQALADHCGGALERIRAEEQIRASLREKEVLLKEIHHRVKNNLQIISSLLSLQSNTVADSQALEILRESQNRVKSMALVHEKLYRSPDLARIDFAEYVRSLTAQLFRTYAPGSGVVELQTQIEGLWLDVDTAVPCGLIINELVSNALKYAFPDGRSGKIRVAVDRGDADRLALRVVDNGVGFPANVDYRNTTSLGLQLVNTLADQIGGTVELERYPETAFKIVFRPPGLEEKRQ